MTIRWTNLAFSCALAVGACKSDEKTKTVNVDPSTLRAGPIRHDELSPELIERITKVQQVFKEVDASPLPEWIDNFQRDQHPEREVAIYEAMARAYTAFCNGRPLTLEAKREVYAIVLKRSMYSGDTLLQSAQVSAISHDDVLTILKLYELPPTPIRISP